jgi:hypothetical protein
MKTHIFHLQIIPVENIITHEEFDPRRTKPLAVKIVKDGIFTNPIIVTNFGKDKFLQLDGMNRLSVMKLLKFPYILAQIIDYNDQDSVELSSWSHLFHADKAKFMQYITKLGLQIRDGQTDMVGHRYIKEQGTGRLCTFISLDKKTHIVSSNGDLLSKVNKLVEIVDFYKSKIIRDILPSEPSERDVANLFKAHTDTNMIISFPIFTRHQIIDIVRKNGIFPTGVSRHIIKRRCLNLNIPLEFFRQKKSIEALNAQLEKRLQKRGFRVYEEQTIFFE